jgi:hypothetical protein
VLEALTVFLVWARNALRDRWSENRPIVVDSRWNVADLNRANFPLKSKAKKF